MKTVGTKRVYLKTTKQVDDLLSQLATISELQECIRARDAILNIALPVLKNLSDKGQPRAKKAWGEIVHAVSMLS